MSEYSIRKIKPEKWRGYRGGVRVIEFRGSETESAEQTATLWLAKQNSPKPVESPKAVEPNPKTPRQTVSITINTDGISAEQKAAEKFKSAYRDMHAQLSAPRFIPVLCAHEIAHKIYFIAAGVKEHQFKPHPAQLRYDTTKDAYL